MTGRSHLLIGGFSILCAMRWNWLLPDPLSVFAGLFGSLLPDIDTERSILGARIKLISRFLAKAFGHRGLTHSAVVLLLTMGIAGSWWGYSVLRGPLGALFLGVATHIIADLLTGGCQVLAPLSRSRISFWPYVRTGGIGEFMLLMPTLILLGWLSFAGRVLPASHSHFYVHHIPLRRPDLKDISFPS
ncbi:metal-dependent hydrolase [Swingsia samuiensis]|uniref:Metal-dependent hydrolase n=1 Tax=Swingsia samuiensis TaxID=1293412 RepID=A0A4Y6UKN0_9PROT|nr:metal-dependent hydrolase [Swingsia samuiensis]QDH17350.1 metal-dependent hydrolase [Swingsia samuiensis]